MDKHDLEMFRKQECRFIQRGYGEARANSIWVASALASDIDVQPDGV